MRRRSVFMARSLSAHIKRIWPPYLRLIPSYFVINACATTTPFSPDGYREGGEARLVRALLQIYASLSD